MRWLAIAVVLFSPGCDVVDLDSSEAPVIGGRVVGAGEFPNVVALVDDAGDPLCSGTLIRADAVLTAAHCLDPRTGDPDPEITFANDARAIANPPLSPIASAQAHPSFAIDRAIPPGVGEFFDVAVLILAEPVVGVSAAALPSVAEAEANLIPGAEVDLVGYGLRVDDLGSPDRGEKAHGVASITAVGDSEVQISMPGEQQSCNGDSGGPAFLDVPGAGIRLIGIVSRSADNELACDSGSIDTRVDAYLDFIDAALGGSGGGGDGGPGGGGGSGGGGSGTGGGGIDGPREGGCAIAGRGSGATALVWLVLLAVSRRRR